jgi:hypothetical protein
MLACVVIREIGLLPEEKGGCVEEPLQAVVHRIERPSQRPERTPPRKLFFALFAGFC